jgi:hypothetical protein
LRNREGNGEPRARGREKQTESATKQSLHWEGGETLEVLNGGSRISSETRTGMKKARKKRDDNDDDDDDGV